MALPGHGHNSVRLMCCLRYSSGGGFAQAAARDLEELTSQQRVLESTLNLQCLLGGAAPADAAAAASR